MLVLPLLRLSLLLALLLPLLSSLRPLCDAFAVVRSRGEGQAVVVMYL
jgi:hypothetical protein